MIPAHDPLVALGNVPGQGADLEAIGADLADRGDLGRRSGQEALLRLSHLFRHDLALDHFQLPGLGEVDHRAHDRHVGLARRHSGDERLVDLDLERSAMVDHRGLLGSA